MKTVSTVQVLACWTALVPLSALALDEAAILEPVGVVECADFLGAPVSLQHRHGRFYVLDPMEQVVWTLAELRDVAKADAERAVEMEFAEIQLIELPTTTASALFFGCGDVLHLVDPMERALFAQEPMQAGWQRLSLGYRVFFGAGDEHAILFNADRRHDAHLVSGVVCDGDTLRFGSKLTHSHPYPSVTNNLNYTRLALAPDLLVVGHIALGYLQIFERDGARLGEIFLSGPQMAQVRHFYLASLGMHEPGDLEVDHATLLDDLIRAARPERFPLPVYINDLAVHAGLIWVLSNGTLQIHGRQGALLARHTVGGHHRGEQVIIHAFCITAEGRLFGLDAVHYHKIYDFGPAAMLAPGVSAYGNEGGTDQRKESAR